MALSSEHQKFIRIEQCLIPVVFNFFLNALIAWLVFKSVELVPLWGHPNVGGDILLTTFLLPFLITLISAAIIKKHLAEGKVPPLPVEQQKTDGWMQKSPTKFGAILGLLGVLVCGIPMVWLLMLGQMEPIPTTAFILFKSTWAALLTIIVSPLVGWWALNKFSHLAPNAK